MQRHPYLCLLTVTSLTLALLVSLVGIIWLEGAGGHAPPSLVAIAGATVGALAAYLAQVQDPHLPPR